MPRQRDYAREYKRRLALGRERGVSRAAARGHRATPERPERALRRPWDYESYASRRLDRIGEAVLAEWNLRRAVENKGDIAGDDPGPRAGRRQMVGPTLPTADAYTRSGGIPANYVTVFREGDMWLARIAPGKSARRAA